MDVKKWPAPAAKLHVNSENRCRTLPRLFAPGSPVSMFISVQKSPLFPLLIIYVSLYAETPKRGRCPASRVHSSKKTARNWRGERLPRLRFDARRLFRSSPVRLSRTDDSLNVLRTTCDCGRSRRDAFDAETSSRRVSSARDPRSAFPNAVNITETLRAWAAGSRYSVNARNGEQSSRAIVAAREK